jgi:hypothetical protein
VVLLPIGFTAAASEVEGTLDNLKIDTAPFSLEVFVVEVQMVRIFSFFYANLDLDLKSGYLGFDRDPDFSRNVSRMNQNHFVRLADSLDSGFSNICFFNKKFL